MKKPVVAVVAVALAVGLVAGFFLGRWHLDYQWSQPAIDPPSKPKGSAAGPTGKILRPMPLRRSRLALSTLSQADPVVVTVGAVGRDDQGVKLRLVLKNRGDCVVTAARGVAYGFDARGAPAALGPGGEPFLPFEAQAAVEAGASAELRLPLPPVEVASIVLAHVDEARCQDGSTWRRGRSLARRPPRSGRAPAGGSVARGERAAEPKASTLGPGPDPAQSGGGKKGAQPPSTEGRGPTRPQGLGATPASTSFVARGGEAEQQARPRPKRGRQESPAGAGKKDTQCQSRCSQGQTATSLALGRRSHLKP